MSMLRLSELKQIQLIDELTPCMPTLSVKLQSYPELVEVVPFASSSFLASHKQPWLSQDCSKGLDRPQS